MTNVSTTVKRIYGATASGSQGEKLGFLDTAAKVAQNDTVTITNANTVIFAGISIDATGASEANTLATNVITCTSSTTGAVSGFVYYK